MKEIEIKPVETKSQLADFIHIPWTLYENDPMWVPPLKLAVKDLLNPKHPFYETAETKMFLAYVNNVPAGRIMAIVNHHHNKFHNEKTGFFGFYECIQDEEVSNRLFQTAETFCQEKGMNTLRGPVHPSTNYECGLLVQGHDDPPQLMMTYNPKYYANFIESFGFKKSMDLLAYQLPVDFEMPEKIVRISDRVQRSKKVTFRPVNKKSWGEEVDLMLDIYNKAWEKNWGFIPMTTKEFYHTAKDLKSVVDEDLVIFAEVDGEPAGFIVTLPDFNQVLKQIPSGKLLPTGIFKLLTGKKNINRLRTITMGVKKEFQKMGLETLLYRRSHEVAKKLGYKEAELSWVLEDNLNMNKPLQLMGAKPYKTYRVYDKDL